MKRKNLGKLKPLICKKRSKKRKVVIHEYENNISNLMKKLKITDNDSECSSSDENMPPDIRAFKSSMRNKFIRCNLKTYSSYSSSENLNIYKKAESKCIRFISINTYLQGKVFSLSNSTKLAIPYYQNKNKCIITAPKPLLNITNTFDLDRLQRCLMHGKFGSVLNLSLKFTKVHKSINFELAESFMYEKEFILSTRQLSFLLIDHLKKLALRKCSKHRITDISFKREILPFARNEVASHNSSRYESEPYSNISRSYDLLSHCDSVETDFISKLSYQQNISNHYKEGKKYDKGTLNRNMDRMKQTIIDLMYLDLEIEKYIYVFKVLNHTSPSVHDISQLKKKFADLVIECRFLQADNCMSNDVQCVKNNLLRSKMKTGSSHGSYGDYKALDGLKKTVDVPYIPLSRKRNCKRTKRDKEENPFVLKRSKKLDECILKALGVNDLVSRNKNIPTASSESIWGTNVQQVYEGKNLVKDELVDSILGSDGLPESSSNVPSSTVMYKEGIDETSSKLPSFHEAFKDIIKIKNEIPESENPSETKYYDVEDGRKLVILPYVNIY